MLDFAQRAGKKGSGRGGRGVYQEETRRGEGHDEEGAAARPAVDAGKKKPSQGRRSRKGKQTIRFFFFLRRKKIDDRGDILQYYRSVGRFRLQQGRKRWASPYMKERAYIRSRLPKKILRPGL